MRCGRRTCGGFSTYDLRVTQTGQARPIGTPELGSQAWFIAEAAARRQLAAKQVRDGWFSFGGTVVGFALIGVVHGWWAFGAFALSVITMYRAASLFLSAWNNRSASQLAVRFAIGDEPRGD